MLEKDIERKVGDYVKSLGGISYKFVSPGRRGVPDRMVVLPGAPPFFIEFKKPGGVLSSSQKREIKKLQDRGQDAYVVDDVEDGKFIVDLHKC